MSRPKSIDRQRFALEYVIDHNGPAALARMGYTGKNLQTTAWHLRLEPEVADAIRKAEMIAYEATKMEVEEIYAHLGAIARGEVEGTRVCDRLKALDQIADVGGLKKTNLNVNGNVIITGADDIRE